ncbi:MULTISPECIES: putative urea ABC transporter substrate-binding protein [unclassified Methylophaga]|jgi:NitT/TauT family transport system substrate-binding protein|uniref:putative urea ABC transporter substrate-binding protein n=1 Tax=unclassified Methylophaga TaxID=2629249 RepID=UPI000E98AA34|nr:MULTISPECIES: putative urea ABC transporter substrate-binding protein [unclassified Methylophaga]HBX59567.1 lipid kinase [Methylophaga sp.]|tara:strand:- start:3148 stop:4215 length:1068 start_codon:yes stop_codon:yes gene_type:complete
MKRTFYRIGSVLLLSLSFIISPLAAHAETKDKFSIAWTIYAGWMPWDYADNAGIVKKWADKYDIEIDVVQINDYIESINQYTAGQFDGCTMTNMDALTIPAAGGVDSTALIIGDFSNGNDGIVLKGADKKLADIKGQRVNLVELSVSHYLLARALDSVDMSERDVTVVNTSDADLVGVFNASDVTSTVTWNPLLSEITAIPDTTKVFDSSDIPGEIIDLLVVNTETLEANPAFGKALTGAWYEIMAKMQAGDEEALTMMAEASGTDLAGYQAQLDATNMFYTAAEAVSFANSDQLQATMKHITDFSFDHGLLGDGAMDADFIGIAYPDGDVAGDKNNVKLRFDSSFMKMAADNAL